MQGLMQRKVVLLPEYLENQTNKEKTSLENENNFLLYLCEEAWSAEIRWCEMLGVFAFFLAGMHITLA